MFLLVSAAALSLVSAVLLRTHQGLTDAVGPSSLSLARPRPRHAAPSLIDKVGNPFTLTVLVFSLGLAAAAFAVPGPQLAPLDKVLALLQSVAMALVAYPAAEATGQCLLQTSPPVEAAEQGGNKGQMAALHSGLRDVQNHPKVVAVEPVHVWQLTPHHPQGKGVSTFFIPGSPTQKRRRQSVPSSAGGGADDGDRATLVVTLHIRVRHDCSDEEMRGLAAFARERCRSGLRVGRGGGPEGDVAVEVGRAGKGEEVRYYEGPVGGKGRRESFGGDVLGGYGGGGGFEPASFDAEEHGHRRGYDAHAEAHSHEHSGHSHAEHGGHSHAH